MIICFDVKGRNLTHVFIADDGPLLTNMLATQLGAKGFNIAGTATNGKELIKNLKHLTIDLVLMDYRMPIMNGIEATSIITKKYPSTKVLMLSSFDNGAYIEQAIKAGAQGYMLKDTNPDVIATAINTIMEGGNYFSPSIYKNLLNRARNPKPEDAIRLSKKERNVLDLLSNGFTSDEISVKMNINVHTVISYRKNMLVKFNAKNVAHLVTIAIEKGFLSTKNLAL